MPPLAWPLVLGILYYLTSRLPLCVGGASRTGHLGHESCGELVKGYGGEYRSWRRVWIMKKSTDYREDWLDVSWSTDRFDNKCNIIISNYKHMPMSTSTFHSSLSSSLLLFPPPPLLFDSSFSSSPYYNLLFLLPLPFSFLLHFSPPLLPFPPPPLPLHYNAPPRSTRHRTGPSRRPPRRPPRPLRHLHPLRSRLLQRHKHGRHALLRIRHHIVSKRKRLSLRHFPHQKTISTPNTRWETKKTKKKTHSKPPSLPPPSRTPE